ncbi:hypothetical protein G6F32_017381 [Rhizopus arrhizus]|nr:hypothetical protein G6F32_017381 [Rhizopus arrhizus]
MQQQGKRLCIRITAPAGHLGPCPISALHHHRHRCRAWHYLLVPPNSPKQDRKADAPAALQPCHAPKRDRVGVSASIHRCG